MASAFFKTFSNKELEQVLHTILGTSPDPEPERGDTALVIIDMQYVDAHPDYGIGAREKELGLAGSLDYYWSRLGESVVPNIQRLLAAARRAGVEVVHVKVGSQTLDGRDQTLRYKARRGKSAETHVSLDSVEGQILPEVKPEGDELVVSKVTSSVFSSTNIDRLLRNMGINNLIMTGVVTNGCVESSTRSAVELDYNPIVVEDATAAMAPQLHEHAILSMSTQYIAAIKSTDEVVEMLEAL